MTRRETVAAWLDQSWVRNGILVVILVNAVFLGLETSTQAMEAAGGFIKLVDRLCLSVFVLEIALKFYAQRLRFFR
ncbi:MAG: ion transporter, partial [Mangrovicoccus sp.]|nr:ion transporter [Mangrovicoccus sp.]